MKIDQRDILHPRQRPSIRTINKSIITIRPSIRDDIFSSLNAIYDLHTFSTTLFRENPKIFILFIKSTKNIQQIYPFNNRSRHGGRSTFDRSKLVTRAGWGEGGEGGRKPRERKRWRVERSGAERGGIERVGDRGSVQNRCNQPRTLCFNSLDADVCLRSGGTFLHFSSIYARAHCTCAPPLWALQQRCICACMCTRVHHVAGYYRSSAITRTFLLECYRAYSSLWTCLSLPLSLSLFPLNNYWRMDVLLE